jgi:DNA-damage-inducible protein J
MEGHCAYITGVSIMSKNASLNIRTTEEIKKGAEVILDGLGLNISSAVNLFLKQVINHKGIPFDLRLPNQETLQAMDDINHRPDLESADTVEEMFQKIGA